MKKLIGALIAVSILLTVMVPPALAQPGNQIGISCDAAGVEKYEFAPGDTVYAVGTGFIGSSEMSMVNIIVVNDQTWSDPNPIPADITGGPEMALAQMATGGNFPVTAIWVPPLPVGDYDIAFDSESMVAAPDGTYQSASDYVDQVNSIGFIVRGPGNSTGQTVGGTTVGGQVMLINMFELLTQYLSLPMRLMMRFAF